VLKCVAVCCIYTFLVLKIVTGSPSPSLLSTAVEGEICVAGVAVERVADVAANCVASKLTGPSCTVREARLAAAIWSVGGVVAGVAGVAKGRRIRVAAGLSQSRNFDDCGLSSIDPTILLSPPSPRPAPPPLSGSAGAR